LNLLLQTSNTKVLYDARLQCNIDREFADLIALRVHRKYHFRLQDFVGNL